MSQRSRLHLWRGAAILLLPLFLLGMTTIAMAAQDIANLFRDGTPIFDLRDRFEYVDQDGIAADADAHTLRTRHLGHAP